EAVEAAVVGLDATAELEAEGLVGGAYLQASLGLDHDVGAVGGDGAGESLGGNGQGQGAGGKTGEVLHRGFPCWSRKDAGAARRAGKESWRRRMSAPWPLDENFVTRELFTSIHDM